MKTTDKPIGTRKDEPKIAGKTNNQQKDRLNLSIIPVNPEHRQVRIVPTKERGQRAKIYKDAPYQLATDLRLIQPFFVKIR